MIFATYTWSGFHGRVVAHVAVYQNAAPVIEMATMPGPGKTGDLTVMIPIQASAASNVFSATGWLSPVGGPRVVPDSQKSTTPVSWQVEAVPCGPAP